LLVASVAGGVVAYPLERKGSDWIGLALEGSRKWVEDKERANWSAIGATVEVRALANHLVLSTDTQAGGAARSPARLFFGLAGRDHADYARILWPDGVLQSELSLQGGKVHPIFEIERKPTSCPMLFAWSGGEFRFVADFLGVGGLGYLELPGIYSKPDPTETVLLPSLDARDGEYALEVLEPMEECTYLDELSLTVVDHPADVQVVPEEMFAVTGPAPGFRLLAIDRRVFPARAMGTDGGDATRDILEVDRRYAYEVDRDPRFPGLSRRDETLDLDFEGALGELLEASGPEAPIHLVLHGYVEYGYST
jgi:hypothetical protein